MTECIFQIATDSNGNDYLFHNRGPEMFVAYDDKNVRSKITLDDIKSFEKYRSYTPFQRV